METIENSAVKEQERVAKLATILRNTGAVILVGAALTFLIQRWDQSTHALRYFYFLGFTALLALSGFFCGLKLKESKGARTFLGVATLIVTAHACQLGAFIFSRYGGYPKALDHIPTFLRWHAVSDFELAGVLTAGLVVLVPLVYTGFSVLLRPLTNKLTALYLAANALLLIPTRDPDTIGFMAVAALIGLISVDSRVLRNNPAAATREGHFARFLLMLPASVMLARNVLLYTQDITTLFVCALATFTAVVLFVFIPRYASSESVRSTSQFFSIFPTAVAWGCFAKEIINVNVLDAINLAILALPLAGLYLVMSVVAVRGQRYVFRGIASLLAVGSSMMGLICYGGTFASFESVLVAVGLLAYGHEIRSRGTFVMGIATLGISLLYHLRYAADLYAMSPWVSLGVLGVVVTLLASLIERYHREIKEYVKRLRKHFAGQEESISGGIVDGVIHS